MKHDSYYTRALQANDPRFARVFSKLGYGRSDLTAGQPAPAVSEAVELDALRDEYQHVVGKKPYHGWTAAVLREKIAAAQKPA
jgi:hypothetical protein